LLAVLSLGLLAFWGTGDLVSPAPGPDADPFAELALRLACGMLVDLAFVFVLGLSAGTIGIVVLGLAGVLRAGPRLVRLRRPRFGTVIAAAAGATVWALLAVHDFTEPLTDWDARSIWFFHARLIWLDGGVRVASHWTDPSIAWSHPDYPKLLPVLAAQVCRALGFWNEVVPKGALALLAAAPIASALSFSRSRLAFCVVLATLFFTTGRTLSNGFADTYVGLYCALAFAQLAMGLEAGTGNALSAVVFFGVAASLKNEGLVFALAGGVAAAVVALRDARGARVLRAWAKTPRAWMVAAIAAAPLAIWRIERARWGLQGYLNFGSAQTLERARHRLADGVSLRHIFAALANNEPALWKSALVVALLLLWMAVRRLRIEPSDLLPLLAAPVALACITAVYLATPFDLEWQLRTSADRIVITVFLMLQVATALLLRRMGAASETGGAPHLSRD
jgi:hypothetical protein